MLKSDWLKGRQTQKIKFAITKNKIDLMLFANCFDGGETIINHNQIHLL